MTRALPRWPGWVAAAAVAVLALGPLAALLARGGVAGIGPGDWAALRFTLWQAALSALLSVGLAVPVARALARRRFPGRAAVIALLGAPFVLPVVVAVLGILAVFGRGGAVNAALGAAGVPPLSIYGAHGVILAHVFLNLPLAVRMILQGWQDIPEDRFRLVASLGAPVGRLLERPMLRAVLPGAFLTVFLVCLGSFAVALILGGGPAATTLELAIFQALRFDFAPDRAATLALLQLALSAGAAAVALAVARPTAFGADSGRVVPRWTRGGIVMRAGDAAVIFAAVLFAGAPLAAVVLRGLPALAEMPPGLLPALGRSLAVGGAATALVLVACVALSLLPRWAADSVGTLPLALSGMVLGTGILLLLLPLGNPARFALPVTAVVNALGALPFVWRIVGPALRRVEDDHGRLADSLGLRGWRRLRMVTLPLARPALGLAAGLAMALALGDLGVIALVGTADQATLPLFMAQAMGAYRMADAAAAGTVLALGALAAVRAGDWWGRRHAAD